MRKSFKKIVAVAMAATMVLGSSVVAFADNSGTINGAGEAEGHVDKKVTSVQLPTDATTSTFAYTMDPERLINETSHEKYGTAVEFPASNDTGVYFNNGVKGGTGDDKDNVVYKNESKSLKVVNKSTGAIDLTVKAEAVATSGDTDIPLVAKSAIADATKASLYLGLVVGSETAQAIASDAAATKTVSIAGTPGNFKTAVKTVDGNKTYEYRALTLAEYQALDGNSSKTQDEYDATWANTSFKLEGSVTSGKAITSTTTAPTVKVTWSWVDPTATAAPSATATQAVLEEGKAAEIAVSLGLGDLAATGISSFVNKGLGNDWISVGAASYADGKITLTSTDAVDYILASEQSDDRVFEITFNDSAKTKITVTLTAKE